MRCGRRGMWLAVLLVGCGVVAAHRAWSTNPDSQGELTIHVWKTRHEMWLEEGDQVLRRFQVALGKEPTASKLLRGDQHTPEGTYYVCEKRPRSRYHRFLGISYPNIDDAEKGFQERLISADEWADIWVANLLQATPPWSTALGGRVGIHGYGGEAPVPIDWTDGCIAVSDADIDYLYDVVPLGTRVVISD
ncbi:MAG TPA: L,D-transpeptidase [Candidatus Acidoferrales bacterium]|nr:L,D-transpeptidase [Candidatus Acidoferrales bacterium]